MSYWWQLWYCLPGQEYWTAVLWCVACIWRTINLQQWPWSAPTDPGTCNENAVRLANGTFEQEGRVEICLNGVWGTICDYYWEPTDGYVLCKQIGFQNSRMHFIMEKIIINLKRQAVSNIWYKLVHSHPPIAYLCYRSNCLLPFLLWWRLWSSGLLSSPLPWLGERHQWVPPLWVWAVHLPQESCGWTTLQRVLVFKHIY